MVRLIRSSLASIFLALMVFIALTPILWTILGSFKRLKDIVTPVPKTVLHPDTREFRHHPAETRRSGRASANRSSLSVPP